MAATTSDSGAFYTSLSSAPRFIGGFEGESNFNSLFTINSGCDHEHYCETSFSLWPPGVPLPCAVDNLVNAGFHYTGDGEVIACYSCKVRVESSWLDGADPLDVHCRLSPNCQHLKTLKEKERRNERIDKRRKSLKTSRRNNAAIPKSSCHSSCSQTLSSSSQQSTCNTSLDNYQKRVFAQGEQEIVHSCQSHNGSDDNDLKQREARLQTFLVASCPKDVLQIKLSLADAGFYYTGRNDVVKCAFCNGELHTGKIGRNSPLESHLNFFPSCSFAKNHRLTKQEAETELPERTGEHIVKPAKNRTSKFSSDKNLSRLKAENEKLRTSVTCMQCRSTQIQVLMLPCCHIVCCEKCADAREDCPLCMARILGTVKIFMS